MSFSVLCSLQDVKKHEEAPCEQHLVGSKPLCSKPGSKAGSTMLGVKTECNVNGAVFNDHIGFWRTPYCKIDNIKLWIFK